MNKTLTFRELFNSARDSLVYKVEGVIVEFTEQIVEKMNALGMSKSEFASRIDASAPYVTKLMRGGTNFTVESMVKVSVALNCDLEIKLVPRSTALDWIDLVERTAESKPEFQVWSQIKEDVRLQREGLKLVQPLNPPQLVYNESH